MWKKNRKLWDNLYDEKKIYFQKIGWKKKTEKRDNFCRKNIYRKSTTKGKKQKVIT